MDVRYRSVWHQATRRLHFVPLETFVHEVDRDLTCPCGPTLTVLDEDEPDEVLHHSLLYTSAEDDSGGDPFRWV